MNGKAAAGAMAVAAAGPTVVSCPPMLPFCFKPLCLVILLLLAAGLLGCAAAATPAPSPTPRSDLPDVAPTATVSVAPAAPPPRATAGLPPLPTITPIPTRPPFSIPTPYPTVCHTVQGPSGDLLACGPPAPLLKPPPAYPVLDYNLERLVLAVEKGWLPLVDTILHGEYERVEIHLWGNLDYVVQWLEVNGAKIREVRPNYISADVPVRLLGALSRQRGIKRVEEPEHFPCMGCKPQKPSLGAMAVGQSRGVFVFSAYDYPPGNRVMVNNPGDSADLSLGSCARPQKISPALHNGQHLTIAACTPGGAVVSLLFYDDSPDKGLWRAYRQYQVSVSNPPPVAVSPDLSVIKVGQSRAFTLSAAVDHSAPIQVIINEYDYYDPEGNLSFGDCPGQKGESKIFNDGATVTLTGCSVGYGDVNFYRDNILVLDDAMQVWDD